MSHQRNNNWSEKRIRELKNSGRIRDFNSPPRQKAYSSDQKPVHIKPRSAGLDWLEWNLLYWGNERSLSLAREFEFDKPNRKWKFDFAFPAVKLAVEFEGGVFQNAMSHTSAGGVARDIEKYNRAQVLGWRVVRVTAKDYTTALRTLEQLINA